MNRSYLGQDTRRVLTRTSGFLKEFAFSLNPYIGCGFGASRGCPFCYVRALPVASARPGGWGNWVIAKTNLPQLLEKELRQLAQNGRLAESTIFMSSATDPYQGYERTMRLSRRALELFIRFPPHRLLVQTRSPMIERDIDLLKELGRTVIASLTIETDDDSVRRAITPTSASIARRILTAQRLRAAGIYTQVAIAPMLPNRPDRFAAMLDESADRVIVDTYFDGDGSKGRRTRALGIEELYSRLGYQEWFGPGAEAELVEALRGRLGAERVLFSQEGFSAL